MAAQHPFWFKYLWKDWLSSATTRSMNGSERGVYHEMLTRQFEIGSLPSSPAEIAKLSALTVEEVDAAWARVRPCFDLVNGRLVNAKMAEIRSNAMASHHKRRMAGLEGAAKRWGEVTTSDGWQCHSPNSNATPRAYDSDSKASGSALDLDLPEESEPLEPSWEEVSWDEPEVELPAPAQKSEAALVPEVAAAPLDSRSAIERLQFAVDDRGRQSGLLGCWLAVQFPNGVRPPEKLVRKQAKVAGQLAVEYDSETLARMVFGMGHVFPYSEGESWDLFTLRDKASKALAASSSGGRLSAADREEREYERGMEELRRKYAVNGDQRRLGR